MIPRPAAQAEPTARRIDAPRPGFAEGVLVLGFAAAFIASVGGLGDLALRWQRQEEYSHGYFVPLISLWLLWSRREAMVASRGQPSTWGLAAVAAGVAMLVRGELSAVMVLVQFAFLAFLVGLVLCYGGISLLRLALLPIVVLLFSLPLPAFVESQLSLGLQLVSTQLGAGMLRALDVPLSIQGGVMVMGSYELPVTEACSGLRYFHALFSVGVLMAYMYPAALRWRLLVLLSTAPITVIASSASIAITGVLIQRWGSDVGDGFMRASQGWAIFIVLQVVLTLEIMLIERFTRHRSLLAVQQFPPAAPVTPSGGGPTRSAAMLGVAVLMVMLAAMQTAIGPALGGLRAG